MTEDRRDFIKKMAAISTFLASSNFPAYGKLFDKSKNGPEDPWFRKLTRWGQTNITEIDAERYDIQWWRGYWKRTNVQGVIINAGGIVSYYPSKVPFHRQAEFLGNRDLFGDLCRAAQEEGLAVFARMDSNRADKDFYDAHPDWFTVDKEGKPYMAGDLYITCVNGPYYDDHIPAILKEIIQLYQPEGFTDNRWVGLNRDKICYCTNCKNKFRDRTGFELPGEKDWDNGIYRQWIQWNYERRLEIWDLNNQTTKMHGGPTCIWSGMNSGSLEEQSESFRDYKEIGARAEILMLDYQTRNKLSGFQHNGEMGKLIHGLLGWDKLIPESMSLYLNHDWKPTFRLSSQPKWEARLWMLSGIAGGIQPWWHHVSAYHEDRRMYKTAEPVFRWHKENEEFLINRTPIATVGVVWSQQNLDFFGRDNPKTMVEEPWRGITHALLRARIPYLPIHADHIADYSGQFSLLILPNLGIITDKQIEHIKGFVKKGGGLLATGQSGLFDQWGDRREDFALADLFGAHAASIHDYKFESDRAMANTKHSYLRLIPEWRRGVDGPLKGDEPEVSKDRHEILKGFEETDILPFGGVLGPISVDLSAKVIMTYIPDFPVFPPELSWMRTPTTDIPGLIVNTTSENSRIAFLPADIDRRYSRDNISDHGDLLSNVVRWAAKEDMPLKIEGPGLIECHLYEQENFIILHLVNLTSAGTWRHPVEELIPVESLEVKIRIKNGINYTKAAFKVAGKTISIQEVDGWANLKVDSILDHEMIVLS